MSALTPTAKSPDYERIAAVVKALASRGKVAAAVAMVDRILAEVEKIEPAPFLRNLRGCTIAAHRTDHALEDFAAAAGGAPDWAAPKYNAGVCLKRSRQWGDVAENMRAAMSAPASSDDLRRKIAWNLAMALEARGDAAEAAKIAQAHALFPPRSSLSLGRLIMQARAPQMVEMSWVQRLSPHRARLLSVVRGAPCQYGDTVLTDLQEMNQLEDGTVTELQAEDSEENPPLLYVETIDRADYDMHLVWGAEATPQQLLNISEVVREGGMHIEVWSLTRATEAEMAKAAPVRAGLVLPNLGDPQGAAEQAVAVLHKAERVARVSLYAPTLLAKAGDELGAARHKKVLRNLGIQV